MTQYIIKEDGIIKVKEFKLDDGTELELTPEMFLTKNEIIYDIITNRISDEDKLYFKKMNDDDLIMQHHQFGMWIRNGYGLWQMNNPLVEENPGPDSIKHPDNCSFEIMKLVVLALRGEYTLDVALATQNFDDAMKIVGDV